MAKLGMTAYLLDTHAVVWLVTQPDRVPAGVRDDLAAPDARRWVSAASAMELATKFRLGKMPAAGGLLQAWDEQVAALVADELPVTARHALLAGSLEWDHRDPFDRLLAAQAMSEDAILVTADARLRTLRGLRTRW